MKNNILLASTTAILNTFTLNIFTYLLTADDAKQFALNIAQIFSPFIAIGLHWLYVKIDHPPELIRSEAALNKAINTCRKHLKQPDITEEFKLQTRQKLSELMGKQQTLRLDFQEGRAYTSSLPTSSPSGEAGD